MILLGPWQGIITMEAAKKASGNTCLGHHSIVMGGINHPAQYNLCEKSGAIYLPGSGEGDLPIPNISIHMEHGTLFIRGDYSIGSPSPVGELDLFHYNEAVELIKSEGGVSRVVSVGVPDQLIIRLMGAASNTSTAKGLDMILKMFEPKLWYYPSRVKSESNMVGGTLFVSVQSPITIY